MRYFALIIILALEACTPSRPYPAPAFERAPYKPRADLAQIEWDGPKPTLADLDQYVENFRKLAFWTEWHGSHPYIKKWSQRTVCANASDRFRDAVESTLSKLTVATGLRFRIVASPGPCSIRIVEPDSVLGCRAYQPNPYAAPSLFVIGIGTGNDDVRPCIEEELSQIMGLYNDIDYRWTIWNDANNGEVDFLTWHDAVMLRVLYQNELYQSMPEAEAMQIVPRLMRRVIMEIQ